MERDTLVRSSGRRYRHHALDRRRENRAIQRQRGSVVFIVLFSTLVISYLAHRLVSTATAYAGLATTLDNGIRSQQSMLLELQRPLPGPRGCTTQSLLRASGALQPWYICSTGTPPFTANQDANLPSGRIDYNAIFASVAPCPFRRSPGILAAYTSPRAAMTCHLPANLDSNIIATDNIGADTLLFSSPSAGEITTLATVGTLTIADSLILGSSAVLITGGDISINRIISNTSAPIAITIVSAHGDIHVASHGSNVSLLALGRRLIVAPTGPPTARFALPPFIPVPFSGIRPVGAG